METPTAQSEIQLKVAEAIQDDVNKGIVRIDSNFMREAGVRPGDIVELSGQRKTVAIVDRAYPGDIGLNIIRMDGLIRHNAKTAIGDHIVVRKADVQEAKKVEISPARAGLVIKASPTLFKQGLLGRAVVKGDVVSLGGTRRRRSAMSSSPFFDEVFSMIDENLMNFGFGDLKFIVASAAPKQAVIITEKTEVVFNPEAVEVRDEEKTPEVMYEDIGGLSDEIKKIREMVELPLKHPEIFERLGIEPPKGVLLHGPPGTGKTLLAKAVANETNSHFICINGPEVMCVDGNTPIFLNPRGHTPIKSIFDSAEGKRKMIRGTEVIELKEPLKTYGLDVERNAIAPAHITHVARLRGPAIKIALSDGNEVIGSFNQPFLTYHNGKLIWKRLEDLEPGDFVARIGQIHLPQKPYIIPIHTLEGLVSRNGKWSLTSRNLDRSTYIKLPTATSPELMELLGLLWSDGHVNKRSDGIVFANNNPRLRRLFVSLVRKLFGIIKTKTYPDGRVAVYSTLLVRYLGFLGLSPGPKSQQVPAFMYQVPQEQVSAFVRGYFDGDGTVSLQRVRSKKRVFDYPTPILYAKNRSFLIQLQALMNAKLNISTTLRNHPTPKGLMHALVVRGNSGRQAFAQRICSRTKQAALNMISKATKHKEYANIPTPKLLIKTLRAKVPYKAYRNNDYYVYEKGRFTKHSLNKLYHIALSEGCTTPEIEAEFELLTRKDLAWEHITSKQQLPTQDLFDLTVDNDNFTVGNLLLLHNSKYYGQSEENIRKKFEDAEKNAPSIIFIDEIDAIATKREETRGEVERRVVAQLLALMDGLKARGRVVVIAATNVPNILDPALRRPGRFDREIEIGVPRYEGRLNILKIHTRNMPLADNVNLEQIASITHGFVGADLASLAKEAAMVLLRRMLPDLKYDSEEAIPSQILEKLIITKDDFKDALKYVRPSAMREVLVEVPNVNWEHVGGLMNVKQELREAVEWPLKHPEAFKRLGVKPPKGILMYGPPGTGKTMLAKAVATESQSNFILVNGPSLLSKWVGESEKAVRKIFEKARQTAPTIIFFDEMDSLAPHRGSSGDSHVMERVVNQLLSEIDGLEALHDVVIIGATNRPDIMDTALLRPGRFDRIILVPPPDLEARKQIFSVHTRGMPLAEDVDINVLAERAEGYVGADIEAVCREAAILALRKDIKAGQITLSDCDEALAKVGPSVSAEIEKSYAELLGQFKQARAKEMKKNTPSYFG